MTIRYEIDGGANNCDELVLTPTFKSVGEGDAAIVLENAHGQSLTLGYLTKSGELVRTFIPCGAAEQFGIKTHQGEIRLASD